MSPTQYTNQSHPMLHDASPEQQIVIDHLKSGANVVVDAVAGSGKSTTVLSAARAMPGAKILQITYNSALRKEFRDKCAEAGVCNIEVHTYHSLASRYFQRTIHTDLLLRAAVAAAEPPPMPVPAFDLVVLDEVQDCTPLYFRFVVFFARFIPSKFQLLLLGDYMQKIYGFKGADCRFLTQGAALWRGFARLRAPDTFVECELRMSYRVTNQMARFVNCAMLGEARIRACREGEAVVYMRNSRIHLERMMVQYITDLLAAGAKPSDFFVLGASVRGLNSHIRKLENALVSRGVPCHVPMAGATEVDERVINSKVVFATFHSCKGRQRKYVFVTGFDHSYYDIFAKDALPDECPNTLYVAASRATERLWLTESSQYSTDRPLPFLRMTHRDMHESAYVDFKGMQRSVFFARPPADGTVRARHVTPSDLSKFVSDASTERLSAMFDAMFVRESPEASPETAIDIPVFTCTRSGFYEDVSDLNGAAIPAMFFDSLAPGGTAPAAAALRDLIQSHVEEFREDEHPTLRAAAAVLPPAPQCPGDYLYMANLCVAVQERLYFKFRQIERDEYTWLAPATTAACMTRMGVWMGAELVAAPPELEWTFVQPATDHSRIDAALEAAGLELGLFRFTARADAVTTQTLWELKCTSMLSFEHYLQTAIYAWLWRLTRPAAEQREVRLFNVKTGEVYRVEATTEQLTAVVAEALRDRYGEHADTPDEDFMRTCRECVETG